MSESFKPAGLLVASIVAGIAPVAVGVALEAADAQDAARAAEADALIDAANRFEAAEPFSVIDDSGDGQSDLFQI
jgi:hypothetical protein